MRHLEHPLEPPGEFAELQFRALGFSEISTCDMTWLGRYAHSYSGHSRPSGTGGSFLKLCTIVEKLFSAHQLFDKLPDSSGETARTQSFTRSSGEQRVQIFRTEDCYF